MVSDDDKALEDYKATLRRQELYWQALYEQTLQYDRAAVDIGLAALRIVFLINAGAAVALLAFTAQLDGSENEKMSGIFSASLPFVYGLVSAALAAGVAYFYASFVTANAQRSLAEHSKGASDLEPVTWMPRLTRGTAVAMITLTVASLVLFVWGILSTMTAITQG